MLIDQQTTEPSANQVQPDAPAKCEEFPRDSAISVKVTVVDVLSNYTVAGVLVGFTPGEVAIRLSEPMSEQRTVAVHLEAFSFEGQVLYCHSIEGEYEAHVSIDDVEKGLRKTPRFPVTVPAELLPPTGPAVAIVIRDISRDGLGIETPCALETGTTVAVVSGEAFVFAVVRHCQPASNGLFRAGVEMHHVFAKPSQPDPVAERRPSAVRTLLAKCLPGRSRQDLEITWTQGPARAPHRTADA